MQFGSIVGFSTLHTLLHFFLSFLVWVREPCWICYILLKFILYCLPQNKCTLLICF